MNLAEFAKKLRATADQIESLLTEDVAMGGPTTPARAAHSNGNVVRHRKSLHWTQRPENKAKLRKVVRKMQAAR